MILKKFSQKTHSSFQHSNKKMPKNHKTLKINKIIIINLKNNIYICWNEAIFCWNEVVFCWNEVVFCWNLLESEIKKKYLVGISFLPFQQSPKYKTHYINILKICWNRLPTE